jgi:hypothetical protein
LRESADSDGFSIGVELRSPKNVQPNNPQALCVSKYKTSRVERNLLVRTVDRLTSYLQVTKLGRVLLYDSTSISLSKVE